MRASASRFRAASSASINGRRTIGASHGNAASQAGPRPERRLTAGSVAVDNASWLGRRARNATPGGYRLRGRWLEAVDRRRASARSSEFDEDSHQARGHGIDGGTVAPV